jgi:hypothetical protein
VAKGRSSRPLRKSLEIRKLRPSATPSPAITACSTRFECGSIGPFGTTAPARPAAANQAFHKSMPCS